ncbi:MAG: antitoxin [Nakamurella sp.]
MVDFDGLKDKAQDLVGDHAAQIKDGIDKVGDFVAGKIGHGDKIDKAEDAVSGLVDKLAGDKK